MKNTNNWRTDPRIIAALEKRYGRFTFDVCATPESAICLDYFCPERSAFVHDWPDGNLWMNPPFLPYADESRPGYGQLDKKGKLKPNTTREDWVRRAIDQASTSRQITMLLPSSDSKASVLALENPYFSEGYLLVGSRVGYLDDDGVLQGNPRKGSTLIIHLDPRRSGRTDSQFRVLRTVSVKMILDGTADLKELQYIRET